MTAWRTRGSRVSDGEYFFRVVFVLALAGAIGALIFFAGRVR